MNRRDFLLFRTEGSGQQAELSCEHLFMQFQDLCSGATRVSTTAGELLEEEWWFEEPALVTETMDIDSFFTSVLDELIGLESIRVTDLEWLAVGEFRTRVEKLLAAYKSSGGEVRFTQSANKQAEAGEHDHVPSAESQQRIGV